MRFKKFFGNLKDQLTESWQGRDAVERDRPTDPADLPPMAPPAAEPGTPASQPRQSPDTPKDQATDAVERAKQEIERRAREEQATRIEAMFGEFGPDICAYVYTQSLLPGGPARMVEKLGLESRRRDSADLALAERWLEEHGPDAFREKVRIGRKPGEAPSPVPVKPPDESANLRVRAFDPKKRDRSADTGAQRDQLNVNGPLPRPRSSANDGTGQPREAASHSQKVSLEPEKLRAQQAKTPAPPKTVPSPKPTALPPAQKPQASSPKDLMDKALENISRFDIETKGD